MRTKRENCIWTKISNLRWAPEAQSETMRTPQNVPAWTISCPHDPILGLAGHRLAFGLVTMMEMWLPITMGEYLSAIHRGEIGGGGRGIIHRNNHSLANIPLSLLYHTTKRNPLPFGNTANLLSCVWCASTAFLERKSFLPNSNHQQVSKYSDFPQNHQTD